MLKLCQSFVKTLLKVYYSQFEYTPFFQYDQVLILFVLLIFVYDHF